MLDTPPRFWIRDAESAVSVRCGVSIEQLRSGTKRRAIVRPRQLAMYLARVHTHASLQKIGRHFGGRHHTTVLLACRRIEGLIRSTLEMQLLGRGTVELMVQAAAFRERRTQALLAAPNIGGTDAPGN